MCCGGTVIDHMVLEDKVWINTLDHGDECAIYVEKTAKSRCISEGDSVWWQGSNAYWTPKMNRISSEQSAKLGHKEGIHSDISLKRLGYSGVGRPKEILDKYEPKDS